MSAESKRPLISPNLAYDEVGDPYLVGSRCNSCGHLYVGQRTVCAKCYFRGGFTDVKLSETGKVYVWSVVYRSFPGIETPFIDAIVDLDDGAHLKGILRGVEANPETLGFDQPVRVEFFEVTPPGVDEAYMTYGFAPNEEGAR